MKLRRATRMGVFLPFHIFSLLGQGMQNNLQVFGRCGSVEDVTLDANDLEIKPLSRLRSVCLFNRG
jgi:hypothetical protein